jgi:hypothetical protein
MHFRAGKRKKKEKRLYYFGVRSLVPIQIQLLDIENSKKIQTSTPPTVQYSIKMMF